MIGFPSHFLKTSFMKLYASKPLLPRETHTEITSQEEISMAAHGNFSLPTNFYLRLIYCNIEALFLLGGVYTPAASIPSPREGMGATPLKIILKLTSSQR